MRIALVSPYSWTYPGGVTRHIEALGGELRRTGHDVRVLAPFDPHDRLAARLHKGAWPQERERPDWLVPLGRTVGIPANGAVSNLAAFPGSVAALRRELATGGYDVVHIHEPIVPHVGYDALSFRGAPLVGTFHTYSENPVAHGIANGLTGARRKLNHLHVRLAVSEAAAWTGRRFFGGHYRVVPNGVDLPAEPPARARAAAVGAPLRIAFVGQAVERKGLPILLRAFEALRDVVPAELVVVGATPEEVEPLVFDARGVTVLGRVGDTEKAAVVATADVLCAPSLGGESFGMVLTEAFAAGTPAVASDIAGYRDVLRDGRDGVLVPRADATALAETLRSLALDRDRLRPVRGRGGRARAPLRLARGRPRGRRRLRAGDRRRRGAGPRPRGRPAGPQGRPRPLRRPSRLTAAADPEPRAGPAGGALAPAHRGAPRRHRRRRARRRRAVGHGAAAHRPGSHRGQPAGVEPGLGRGRARPHVPVDGRPRAGLARDPARRAAQGAAPGHRRAAGDLHRRAHVRHASGPPGRAVARAHRRPADRAAAGEPPDGDRARSSRRPC